MKRLPTEPRPDWRTRVEEQGLLFHSADVCGAPSPEYCAEGVYYSFTRAEIDVVETATAELHALCVEAAAEIIEYARYAELGIPPQAIPWIERSFSDETPSPSVYGRMDLAAARSPNPVPVVDPPLAAVPRRPDAVRDGQLRYIADACGATATDNSYALDVNVVTVGSGKEGKVSCDGR